MPLSSQRQRFSIFVSPRNEDFLFYEKVDKQRVQESIPEYGDPHPDFRKYPNHFFTQSVQADEEGQTYFYYYAAKRDHQDDYNFEHSTVNHKSGTYDQVTRTYITLRSEYDEDSPALGSLMPIVDADPFDVSDKYTLISREQSRVGETVGISSKRNPDEMDSMFVLEKCVYLKRAPITTTAYDKQTGAHIFTTTNLVHRDETPEGSSLTVAGLIADSSNPFWDVDEETGSHKVIEQVSEEWYYVSSVQNGEANERRVFVYLTPNQKDYLFYELIDRKNEKAEPTNLPAFGELHPEFTEHKFVAATPNDSTGDFYRYYYASDRLTQNSYNWVHATTDLGGTKYATVQRSYVIPRTTYSESSPALATPMPVTAEDPFTASDAYILLNRQKQPLPSDISELDSVYVSEERTYIKRTPITQTSYDDATGYHTFRQTEIVHTSEPPSGQQNTISYLVANTDADFWAVDLETGAHKVVEQLSSEWYAVTSIFDGDRNDRRVFTYVSPDQNDFIFYELVDRKDETDEPENLPSYGDSHPTYTSHKFVAATPADGAGDFYRYYYAAPRLNQNAYNWNFTSTDIGNTRYDAVERASLVERSAYLDETPAQASPMPISASDPFSAADNYVLVSREKRDLSGDLAELSSLFVLDVRTYTQRAPLTTASYSKSTGYHTFNTTEIWYKNEIPTGQTRTISALVADTSDPFWVVDEVTGAHREVQQLSSDWYAVSSVSIGEANDRRVFTYVSPDQNDFIFYEVIDRKDEKGEPENLPAYGTSHPTYTSHKFVAATPADPTGDFYRYYYAAPRLNQNAYNWNFTSTDIGNTRYDAVERASLVERSAYLDETPAQASPMPISASDPFSAADNYVLVSREKRDLSGDLAELSSLFVLDVRTYTQRAPLTTASYSKSTGYHTFNTTEIWYKNEIPTGQTRTISALVADTSDPFWVVDEVTGAHREVQQLSSDWYAVSSVYNGDPNDRRVFVYLTPEQDNFIFYELVDRKAEKSEPEDLPVYGEAHPQYGSHKFVSAAPADATGDFYRYYFAPAFTDQEAYNWAYTSADLGGTGGNKYQAVSRSYVIERALYDDGLPAIASAMPISASDPFALVDDYVLVGRQQQELSGELSELSSVFILDVRTYVKREPLTAVEYDEREGVNVFNTTRIWHAEETPTNSLSKTKDLVLDTGNAFWAVNNDTGEHREVSQLSCEWYAITSVTKTDNNFRRVFTYVSPNQDDFIFYELVDRKNEAIEPINLPAYGDLHPEYTTHKFVFLDPADSKGDYYKLYYAAVRSSQNEYNWRHSTADLGGNIYDSVTRTYVVERSAYSKSAPALASAMPIAAGDPFTSSDGYILVSRRQAPLSGTDGILKSIFVLEAREYIKRVPIVRKQFDEQFGKTLTTTVTLAHKSETSKLVAKELDSSGYVTEVSQLTAEWYAVTRRRVMNVNSSGLVRTFDTTENYLWPTVLSGFQTQTWKKRGTDVAYTFTIPKFEAEAYKGPCNAKVEVYWKSTPFTTLTNIIPMIPDRFDVKLPLVQYQSGVACLHPSIRIYGTTGTEHPTWGYLTWNFTVSGTNYTTWPDSIVASDDQRPYRGGYLRQKTTIYKPDVLTGYGDFGGVDQKITADSSSTSGSTTTNTSGNTGTTTYDPPTTTYYYQKVNHCGLTYRYQTYFKTYRFTSVADAKAFLSAIGDLIVPAGTSGYCAYESEINAKGYYAQ